MAYALMKLLKVDNMLSWSSHTSYSFPPFHTSQHANDSSECTDNRVNHLGLLYTLSCHSSYLSFLSYLRYFIGHTLLYWSQLERGNIMSQAVDLSSIIWANFGYYLRLSTNCSRHGKSQTRHSGKVIVIIVVFAHWATHDHWHSSIVTCTNSLSKYCRG